MLNKENLINDLKELHIEIVEVYKSIFEYKFEKNSSFRLSIEEEYKRENLERDDEKTSWNLQYIHRSSYTLLNKILFIRICEDKGFMLNDNDKVMGQELDLKVGQKLSMIGLQKWSNLISNYSLTELIKFAFKDMNKSYKNINLYKDDIYDWLIPNNAEIENSFNENNTFEYYHIFETLLKKIIETLDTSRYNFGNSTDNVLGDVYEKFMDRETRKKLGQFYTPDYIIEYILMNTMDKTNVVENPFVKVLDPACGSGHFLIMAYDILKGKFEQNISRLSMLYASETYVIYEGDEKREIKGSDYWKKENIHYHILNHCIYGADIDSFAIQLTTINLLLKDLDNFTDRINIIESDSLVKWEQDYGWEELESQIYEGDLFLTLNSKDPENNIITLEPTWDEATTFVDKGKFWSQKFDYIVGNPPYISFGLRGVNKIDNEYYNYILNKYSNSAEYKISIYALFIERGMELLKEGGKLSYITPDSFLLGMYFQKIRQHILNRTDIEELLILNYEVFQDASIGKGIVSLFIKQKADDWNVSVLGAFNENEVQEKKFPLRFQLPQDYFNITPKNRFYVVYSEEDFNILKQLQMNKTYINDYCKLYSGCIGKFGKHSMISDTRKNEHIIYNKGGKEVLRDEDAKNRWRPLLGSGRRIQQYIKNPVEEYIYVHEDEDMRKKYAKSGFDLEKHEGEKILIRQTGSDLITVYDNEGYFCLNNMHIMYKAENKYSLKFFTALLNSYLYNFYYHTISMEQGRVMPQTDIDVIEELPVLEVKDYDRLEQLSDDILVLNNQKTILSIDNKVLVENREQIIEHYLGIYKQQIELDNEILAKRLSIEYLIMKELDLNDHEIRYIIHHINGYVSKEWDSFIISNGKGIKFKSIKENLVNEISSAKLMETPSEQIAKEYEVEVTTINHLKFSLVTSSTDVNLEYLIDMGPLKEKIKKVIIDELYYSLNEDISYFSNIQCRELLKGKLSNFNELMLTYSIGDTVSNNNIIKGILNDYSSTWNSFRKNKEKNKSIFVKYDTTIYGLTNWSDEIHKKYLIDAIDYYTSDSNEKFKDTVFEDVSKTKKKAETALKNLKQLDFEDKEEYLKILTDKVKKAFD